MPRQTDADASHPRPADKKNQGDQMSLSRKIVVLSAVLMAMGTAPCFAQDVPPVEVSGGYNFLQLTGEGSESLPAGWFGEVAGNLNRAIAVVGQITGNYKAVGVEGINVDLSIHTYGGGVRFLAGNSQVAPFGQMLLGVARVNASSNASGLLPFDVSESANEAFLQLGGGINLMRDAPIGLRIGGDYVRVLGEDGGNVFRFAIGLTVPLGR
jgi:hypothetical protein